MSQHLAIKIPFDDEYIALLGKAVYVLAYYEWNIIYIIDYLDNGFVSKYSRTESMVSGKVSKSFKTAIDNYKYFNQALPKAELEECYRKFNIIREKKKPFDTCPPNNSC